MAIEPTDYRQSVKVVLVILAFVNTGTQLTGLVMTSWGCRKTVDGDCIYEKLFETCLNGTCFQRARYKGLATLALSSFFLNAFALLISFALVLRICCADRFTGSALWKWIVMMSFVSNLLSAVVLVVGALEYDKLFSLLVFSLCGTVVTSILLLVFAASLFYYVWHFVEFFSPSE